MNDFGQFTSHSRFHLKYRLIRVVVVVVVVVVMVVVVVVVVIVIVVVVVVVVDDDEKNLCLCAPQKNTSPKTQPFVLM